MSGKHLSAFFLGVSLFGLAVVVLSAFYQSQIPENFSFRKPLIGSVFALFCIAGMVAVFSPNKCSRAISFRRKQRETRKDARKSFDKSPGLRGHHPDCGNFSAHVIQVGGRTLCAGCTGLFIGGLMALVGALAYFFAGFEIGQASGPVTLIGALGVIVGLFLPATIKMPLGSARLVVNAIFPFGSFLVLAGVDSLAQSISLDVFLMVLIFFWLFTKISLSQWGHGQVCRLCKVSGCVLRGF